MFDLVTVERIYQDEAYGWIYRFYESTAGVLVKRVPEKNPLWDNAALVQIYDIDQDKFVSAVNAGGRKLNRFPSIEFAKEKIWELAIQEA